MEVTFVDSESEVGNLPSNVAPAYFCCSWHLPSFVHLLAGQKWIEFVFPGQQQQHAMPSIQDHAKESETQAVSIICYIIGFHSL